MKATFPTLLLVAVLAAACAPLEMDGDGTAFARLGLDPTRVRAGDPITLTLTNRSDRQIGYNLCPAVLDRRVGGEWQEHPERPAEVCTMELRILEPGASDTFRHTLPATLPAGSYRFRLGVEWPLGEDRAGVASEPFEVERA